MSATRSLSPKRQSRRRLTLECLEGRRLLTAAPHPFDLSALDGSNGFRLEGTYAEGRAGKVSDAGDVNGDGFDDWIIGAQNNQFPEGDYGSAYVVFGNDTGFPTASELDQLDGSNGFQMRALSSGRLVGVSVAGAGDVNGDGFADVLVGDQDANNQAGAAYLVFGKAGGFDAFVDLGSLDGSDGFRMAGQDAYEKVGSSLDGAGDVNGDGYADIILGVDHKNSDFSFPFGTPTNITDTPYTAYVVYGKANGFAPNVDLSTLDGNDGFKIEDAFQNNRIVSAAGDINGDGLDDVMIGRPNAGEGLDGAYVIYGQFGGSDPVFNVSDLDGTNGFTIVGGENLGRSVAAAGDVNGDGTDDFMLHGLGNNQGELFIIFGKTESFASVFDVSSLDGTNGFRLAGESNAAVYDRQNFGISASGAGDFNGDGYDDLIIGTKLQGGDWFNQVSGYSYLVFGKPSEFNASMNVSQLDGENGFRIDAPLQPGFLGSFSQTSGGRYVSSAGDINQDGFDDLLIGAPDADTDAETIDSKGNAGWVYVLYGHDGGSSPPGVTATIVDGNVFIEGDDSANHLRLRMENFTTLHVEGLDGTTINALPSTSFAVNSQSVVQVTTGKGRDTVQVLDTTNFDPIFDINTGPGRDYVDVSTGRFEIATAGGNDHVVIHTDAFGAGLINLNTGNGDDRLSVIAEQQLSVTGDFMLGNGDDIVTVGGTGASQSDHTGTIFGGDGVDRIFGGFGGGFSSGLSSIDYVSGGCSGGECFVGGDATTEVIADPDIGNILVIKGNDHFDSNLQLSSTELGQVTVSSSGFGASINGGVDPVAFSNIARVKVVTGSGSDTIVATGLLLSDKLIVNSGLGDDSVQLIASTVEKLKIDTGGGDDQVLIDTSTINRRSKILTGWGEDEVTIRDSIFGRKLILEGGLNDDTLNLLGENLFNKGIDEDFEL